jgi:hypothetical protein
MLFRNNLSRMNALLILKREAQQTLKIRGVIGTIRAFTIFPFVYIKYLALSRNRTFSLKREANLGFDSRYGVDTNGNIRLSSLGIESKNWIYGIPYVPTSYDDFGQLLAKLAKLEIAYEQFIFIDFGSGKGRPVLQASALPFKKIIGIEFSKRLTSIAENNLRLYPKEEMKCKDIGFICMDAAEYCLPEEPLVLYFFNPFRAPVMSQVIDNVAVSLRKKPRRIIVLYLNPDDAYLWDSAGFLTKVSSTPELCIYDTRNSEMDTKNGT